MYLDPGEDKHAPLFAEVYGTRLEVAFFFILTIDLPALDLSMWKKRLDFSRSDMESLKKYIDNFPNGPIQILLRQYPIIFSVLEVLHSSLEIATFKKRLFKKEEVKALVNADIELFNSRQLIQKCGERGKGVLYQIDTLTRLQQNILQIGKTATQNFGRFSGLSSFTSFIFLIVIMYFTDMLKGNFAVLYYFGALILSLIVGFGYGALRFKPLVKLFADAMQKEPKD